MFDACLQMDVMLQSATVWKLEWLQLEQKLSACATCVVHLHPTSSFALARKHLFVMLTQQHASGLSKVKEGVCGAEGLPILLGSCIAHGLENHGFKEGVTMLPGLSQSFIPPCHVPF